MRTTSSVGRPLAEDMLLVLHRAIKRYGSHEVVGTMQGRNKCVLAFIRRGIRGFRREHRIISPDP